MGTQEGHIALPVECTLGKSLPCGTEAVAPGSVEISPVMTQLNLRGYHLQIPDVKRCTTTRVNLYSPIQIIT